MSSVGQVSQGEPVRLAERTLILQLRIGRPGVRRKVAADSVEVRGEGEGSKTDRDLLHVAKEILDSDELRGVRRFDGAVRAEIAATAIPSTIAGNGKYLVAAAALDAVDSRLRTLVEERVALRDRFLAAYPLRREEARARLGPLYDEGDYPTREALRAAFSFEWAWLALETPSRLREINRAVWEREREKAAVRWSEAVDEAKVGLRAEMRALVDHMVERLEPGEDGKKKVFRGTLVANLAEFLGGLELRNVVDDEELSQVAARAGKLLEGVDPETLRAEDSVRDALRSGMAELRDRLDELVADRPRRLISFSDDEEVGP